MGKPATYKKLAIEQRKAAKRARKEARRKSTRTADVILPGACSLIKPDSPRTGRDVI
jgi:hypothetical protein